MRELGIGSLREASLDDADRLPEPLGARVRHIVSENERVRATVAALDAGDLAQVGELLNASHVSLRDDFAISTPAVEATVERLRDAGAIGARIVGGGFGGHVLGLLPARRGRARGRHRGDPGPRRAPDLLGAGISARLDDPARRRSRRVAQRGIQARKRAAASR